jgi:hypothetical protein
MENHYDWTEVVELHPSGYCEMQDPQQPLVYHGDVESIGIVSQGTVVITLKWVLQMGTPGSSEYGKWKQAPEALKRIVFPNYLIPFVIEGTPEKGRRIRFGLNIIYLATKSSLDPSRYQ